MKRQLFLSGAAAVAMLVAAGGHMPAMANGEEAMPPPPPPVVYAPIPTWEGPYAGVHAGFGANDLEMSYVDDASSSALHSLGDAEGGLAGVHAGYNWQFDQIVAGVEVDAEWFAANTDVDIASTDGFKGDIDFLASLRARLGYDVDGETLIFASAGGAYIESNQVLHAGNVPTSQEHIEHDWGVVGGVGVAHKVSEHLSLRAETLFYYFFEEDWICQTSCGGNEGSDVGDLQMGVYTFRVGATVHF